MLKKELIIRYITHTKGSYLLLCIASMLFLNNHCGGPNNEGISSMASLEDDLVDLEQDSRNNQNATIDHLKTNANKAIKAAKRLLKRSSKISKPKSRISVKKSLNKIIEDLSKGDIQGSGHTSEEIQAIRTKVKKNIESLIQQNGIVRTLLAQKEKDMDSGSLQQQVAKIAKQRFIEDSQQNDAAVIYSKHHRNGKVSMYLSLNSRSFWGNFNLNDLTFNEGNSLKNLEFEIKLFTIPEIGWLGINENKESTNNTKLSALKQVTGFKGYELNPKHGLFSKKRTKGALLDANVHATLNIYSSNKKNTTEYAKALIDFKNNENKAGSIEELEKIKAFAKENLIVIVVQRVDNKEDGDSDDISFETLHIEPRGSDDGVPNGIVADLY